MSRRLAEHLSRDDEWRTDPSHAGADLWVITKALVRECRCAQVFLGAAPGPRSRSRPTCPTRSRRSSGRSSTR